MKNRLDAMTVSIAALRPRRIADTTTRIATVEAKIVKEHELAVPNATKLHHLKRRRERLRIRFAVLTSDTKTRLCFGSRRLFTAQHHLDANGFASRAAWQQAWRAARTAEFFVLGSKDESAGCQGCLMTRLSGDRFRLRLRAVGAARAYVTFNVRIAYGAEHLVAALAFHQAISYRFKRDAKGWRVFISTQALPVKLATSRDRGCIGVDQNDGFVSVSESDRYGNIVALYNLAMATRHLGTHATRTVIAEVVKHIVAYAMRVGKPISIERLNFEKKKAQLCYASHWRQVMLSAFGYRAFAQLLAARAHDAGVELLVVNPAYSSKIGRQKYARRYGLSVHLAAALVLARRGQGFRDRYVSSGETRRRSTREDAATPVLVAKERAVHGRAKVEPGLSSRRRRDPVRAERPAIPRKAAGGIPARESLETHVRQASWTGE